MAVRYFDLNGATAGFGTLTGAWDTTSAFWSTSSAGTVAPTAYTFTNADTAQFGFTGTTATAGTATISTGITVTLNSITTANLAGLQTIAAAGTGAITLAGTTPSVVVGSAGGLTISAPIGGTAGLAFSGGNVLTLSGANTFTGAFTQATGTTRIGNAGALGGATATLALSGGTISSSSTTAYTITNAGASTISGNITLGDATNTGALTFTNAFGLGGATRTLTIASAVTLSGIIGTVSDGGITKAGSATLTLGGANTFTGAFSGSAGTTVASTATSIGAAASTAGISSTGTHQLQFATAPTYSGRDVTISGTGGGFGALRFSSTSSGTNTFKSITLTGAASIQADAVTSGNTQTVTTGATAIALGGNTLSLGVVIANAGTFSLSSQISGTGGVISSSGVNSTTVLSATNSDYTGTTAVPLGILRVASLANVGVASSIGAPALANATISLGANGSTSLLYTGTANVSTDRVLNLAGATSGVTLGTTSTGNVTYTSNLTVTGSGAKTLFFTGSSTGIVTLTGVVPDSAGGATSISVTGGTHYLAGTANTFTGTTSVYGVLQFNSIKNVSGGSSSLGAPTTVANGTISLGTSASLGTIRYLGTGAANSDRVINLAGTTGGGGIDASGTGTLTLTSPITATGVGAKGLLLGGFTTGAFSGAITDAGGNVITLLKQHSGAWTIPSVSNTFTGNVNITGGLLTIATASQLGGATKTITISSSGYRNASLVLAGTGDALASTTTFTVGGSGNDQTFFPQGIIRADASGAWTIAGAVTQTATSVIATDSNTLTLSGLISGAFFTLFRGSNSANIRVTGGLSTGAGGLGVMGATTVEWLAHASNTVSTSPFVNGGVLRLVSDGTIASNPFGTTTGFAFGSVAGAPQRYTYTGGTAEFRNTGAAGNVSLTFTGSANASRGSATMRLYRASTAGALTVNVGSVTTSAGLLNWEYGGTPGTLGTDSKFVVTNGTAQTRLAGSVIGSGYSRTPVYLDANKVVVPMVYDGSQPTVLATQAGGTTLTGTDGTSNHDLSADITAQATAAVGSVRLPYNTLTTPMTLLGATILEAGLILDNGIYARTALSGGRLARSRNTTLNSSTLHYYAAGEATIASALNVPYGTTFVKSGAGHAIHSGVVSHLAGYNLAEGDASFTSTSAANSFEYTTFTLPTPLSTLSTITFAGAATKHVGSLTGGGVLSRISLTGGDLNIRVRTAGSTYAGSIEGTGSQALILQGISSFSTSSTATLSGYINVANVTLRRGVLTLAVQNGASFGSSTTPINFTGDGALSISAANPVSADYTIPLGPITVTQGSGRVTLPATTNTTNFYATRITTSAVPTVGTDGAFDILANTANTLTTFTVTGASTGPMGANWFNGSQLAYYRAAGSLLSGGTYTTVATVDSPIYGTDANFPAAKVAGAAFSAASTDNVSVTGAQSAQTSVTVNSLRTSATITMASTSDRIATDTLISASVTPVVGGQLSAVTGRLYLYSQVSSTISSAIVDGGGTTRLLTTGPFAVTLTGTNTFSGGLAILGPSGVGVASDANLGTGNIDSYGGDLNFANAGSNTITKNIAVYDGGLYLTGSTAGVKLSGVISGTGDVFVAGNGLTLQGANTNSGTLRLIGTYLADSTSLNNFTGIDFAGGIFRATSASTPDISSKITQRSASALNITNTSGADYRLASSFGNSSVFTKSGVTGVTADRVTLAAANYFASATIGNINGGVAVGAVRATATNALGWGTVTLTAGDPGSTGQGAALELSGNITLPNAISTSGAGLSGLGVIRNVSGSNTISGVISLVQGAGNTRIGADVGSSLTLSGGITATTTGRIVEFYGTGTTVTSGAVTGGSFVSVTRPVGAGAGITQLLSANTYSGGTTLVEGTIFAGNVTALGTGSVTMASGTTLQSGTTGGQNGKLTVTGTLTNNGGTIRIGG